MFQWLSGGGRRDRRLVVDALYGEIVAAARQPRLYSAWRVPDTPLGRFEMMSLHVFLLLHRLRGEEGALKEIAQELTDHFFLEVDHSLRELGIGDMGVPKRMKKLARMFYGRLSAYGEAVDQADVAALGDALKRNIAPDRAVWEEAGELASYVLDAHAILAATTGDDLRAGKIRFPPLKEEVTDDR